MRIPFDLIAAVLCIEGIGQYLQLLVKAEHGSRRFAFEKVPLESPLAALLAWGGFLLISWLLNELVIRHVEWRTRFGLHITGFTGRRHPLVSLSWGVHAAQAVTVVVFAVILWGLKWPLWMMHWPVWFGLSQQARAGELPLAFSMTAETLLNLGPFLLAMLLGWLPRRRLAAGIRGRPISLKTFLGYEARLTWLPVALALFQACIRDGAAMLPESYTAWAGQPGVDVLLMVLATGALWMVGLPLLVIWMWQCKPMPPGELKDRLLDLTQRSGVKAREILVWGPHGTHLLNACVLGAWARYRYVLISPALVDELSPRETEAVLAHELGHARYGHLTLLFVMMLGLSALLDPVLMLLPEPWRDSPLVQSAVLIAVITLYIRLVYGAIMRRCECEADLASAELMGTPVPLVTALEKLAVITGNIRDVWSWHHGSLAERVAAVTALSGDPAHGERFHSRLRRFRIAFTVLTVAALCVQFWARL